MCSTSGMLPLSSQTDSVAVYVIGPRRRKIRTCGSRAVEVLPSARSRGFRLSLLDCWSLLVALVSNSKSIVQWRLLGSFIGS